MLPTGQGAAWEEVSADWLSGCGITASVGLLCLQQEWKASGLSYIWAQLSGLGVPRISSLMLTVPPLRHLLCPGAGGSTV